MQEEKARILQMVKDGKVTVEEGLKLLDAVSEGKESRLSGVRKTIRVLVTEGGEEKFKVNIPAQLARVATRFIPKGSLGSEQLETVDIDEVLTAIEAGAEGKILEFENGRDRVEITVLTERRGAV